METLDAKACDALAPLVDQPVIFTSDKYDMYELVSLLRACSVMVSSRYHALVTSMPGLVPSAGVTMDERIRNLMRERGHEHLLMNVDDPDLESRVLEALETLHQNADEVRHAMGRTVVCNLKRMARMGAFLERNVCEIYPQFPLTARVRGWEDYLPPLSPGVEKLLEVHDSHAPLSGRASCG
jgi:polysaccharide pyruvyl transferase WcaK-like protein